MAMASGGYDYSFCDPLPEDCPCPVCKRVQRGPNQLICCGKLICKTCLDTHIHTKKSCPNCNATMLKGKIYFPDKIAERKIKSLRISCRNKNDGCTWTGPLRKMEDTHIPECPNEMVECTNRTKKQIFSYFGHSEGRSRCNQKVQRHLLQQHITKKCKWRVVSCQYCKEKGTHHDITGDHVKLCPDAPLPCPNDGCELKIKRRAMGDHTQTCLKGIVKCQYSQLGCTARIKREDIPTHTQESMAVHLELTANTLEKTTRTLEQTGRALEQTTRDLEATLERIAMLENKEKKRLFNF